MNNFGLYPGHCEVVLWRMKVLLYFSEECSFVFVLVGSEIGLRLKTLPLEAAQISFQFSFFFFFLDFFF